LPWAFALSLFTSAALLFLIQPMIGKVVLAKFGGIPAIWLTCMLFFQAALLAGYAYVHSGGRWLGTRKQALAHVAILLLPLAIVPLGWLVWPFAAAPLTIPADWAPPGDSHPIPWLLLLLLAIIGAPFFALATTAPLLQKWFAATDRPSARDPYYLYAASNLGSLAALLGYPVLCEPLLGLSAQGWLWLVGYLAAVGLILTCLALARPALAKSDKTANVLEAAEPLAGNLSPASPTDIQVEPTVVRPLDTATAITADKSWGPTPTATEPVNITGNVGLRQRLLWVAQAFVPSSMLLATTTYLTTDLAPVPLLWVIPLALYLLTFILAFSRLPALLHRLFVLVAPVAVLVLIVAMRWDEARSLLGQVRTFALHLGALFAVGMACHGALAQTRPRVHGLTEFYLLISLGGVLGGIFNAVIAPLVFQTLAEYWLALVLTCLVLPPLGRSTANPWRIAPDVVTAVCLLGATLILLTGLPASGGLDIVLLSKVSVADQLWLGAFIAPCLVSALIAPIIARGERVSHALDFAIPLILIYATAVLAVSDEPRPAQITVLLFLQSVLLAPVIGLIVIYALQRQPWACAVLGWPLLLGFFVGIYLVRAFLNTLSDDDGPGFIAIGRINSFLLIGVPLFLALISVDRPIRFGLSLGAVLLAANIFSDTDANLLLYRERNFYGIAKVEKNGPFHRLVHGTILHGMQLVGSNEAITYFHRTSPIGELLTQVEEQKQKPACAFVGLGIGTLASYGQPGQEITFYEIDPEIIRIARNPELFTYITDAESRGVRLQIVMGDGRLQLGKAPAQHFGVIVVDAFSSDAIPVHLLTREALTLYFDKLAPGGVLAVHISNRYLDLEPVLARHAQEMGRFGLRRYDKDMAFEGAIVPGKFASDWVLLARQPEDFGDLADKPGWEKLEAQPRAPLWTDDFTSLWTIYRWND
jgi:hypothetical protein